MSRFLTEVSSSAPMADQLRMALAKGEAKQVKKLLRAKADPNGRDFYGDQPLCVPPRGAECVELLLKAGADPESTRADGRRALQVAWELGNSQTVLALLEAGGRPEVKGGERASLAWRLVGPDGLSVFMMACFEGRSKGVQLALAAGCSTEERSRLGSTPLICAPGEGQLEVVKLLIGAGARLDAGRHDGVNAIMAAASGGHAGCLEALVAAGADVGAREVLDGSLAEFCGRAGRSDMLAVIDSAAIAMELGQQADSEPVAGSKSRQRL